MAENVIWEGLNFKTSWSSMHLGQPWRVGLSGSHLGLITSSKWLLYCSSKWLYNYDPQSFSAFDLTCDPRQILGHPLSAIWFQNTGCYSAHWLKIDFNFLPLPMLQKMCPNFIAIYWMLQLHSCRHRWYKIKYRHFIINTRIFNSFRSPPVFIITCFVEVWIFAQD